MARIALFLLLPLWIGSFTGVATAEELFRRLPQLDLRTFACASPTYHLFSERKELLEAIEGLCPGVSYQGLKGSFFRTLEQSEIRWDEEALVVLEDWYGTGMARAQLELTLAAPGVIAAAIVWRVPPPPVTPDTAVFRFAFAVNRSLVDKVVVSGRSPQQVVLAIPKPGE